MQAKRDQCEAVGVRERRVLGINVGMRHAVTTVSEILSYLVTQMVKNLPAIQETHIRSLGSNGKIL